MKKRIYFCKECEFKTKKREQLRAHVTNIHRERKKKYDIYRSILMNAKKEINDHELCNNCSMERLGHSVEAITVGNRVCQCCQKVNIMWERKERDV